MSESPALSVKTASPFKSPSYPQRVHVRERAQWQEIVGDCERRIAKAAEELPTIAAGPRREACERLFAQMLGCRDQVIDAAKRLPMEVGDLYEEDRHRLEEAVAALDRVAARWDAQIKAAR